QVEHPVTELVTGIDLVQWQLRIASGERLSFGQEDVAIDGHAIECRITSEDPDNGFLPSTGRIALLELPAGPGVRWDGAISEGFEVSLFYDPLLGKLITHAMDRAGAIARMSRALSELRVMGIETSAGFHRRVMAERDFQRGAIDIRYLETHPQLLAPEVPDDLAETVAIAAALLEEERRTRRAIRRIGTEPASGTNGWRSMAWKS
ncbi:MAG: acetyl-CoA carboxylase biotin carboxylase subunit, partial [Longimicrobiales bacterium]